MQLSESELRALGQQAQSGTGRFWKRQGWLRYPLAGLLLVACAVALRGGLWSQTPANAAKRAAKRSANAKAKAKSLPKVKMLLEHNERDINLNIKKGKHALPRPKIERREREVVVELAGVQVRPRKWTLSGSRVASINVKVDKHGSKLVISQDPKVRGSLKDAFSAEDVDGNLVLRVLNESIGDHAAGLPRSLGQKPAKVVAASTAPAKKKKKAKHPLGRKLTRKDKKRRVQTAVAHKHQDPQPQPVHAQVTPTPVAAPRPVQVVEHPVPAHETPKHVAPSPSHPPTTSSDTMLKTTLSMAGSVLAFGLLALVPIVWWKKKQQGPNAHLKITERMALSPKHSLVRVQLGGQELWLGLSEGNIQVISPATMRSQAPSRTHAPSRTQAPAAPSPRTEREDPLEAVPPQPDLFAGAPPPTMARRKLQAFKSRLREALAQPESPNLIPMAQDAGRQADAIRRELERRQGDPGVNEPAPRMHRDVA